MSSIVENDEFLDENIEHTYEQLSKLSNAKNEIKSFIALNSEELSKNEIRIEDLEHELHSFRIKIISNPVLRELNTISEENAINQRKQAENIYSELPELSSKLDVYEEKYLKNIKKYRIVGELQSVVEKKLNNQMKMMSSLREEWQKRLNNLKKSNKEEMLKKNQEMKHSILMLTGNLAQANSVMKSLSYEKESKLFLLQKLFDINEQNSAILADLNNVLSESNDYNTLDAKEIELDSENVALAEKLNVVTSKINEMKQHINSLHASRTELSEKIERQKLFLRKKILYNSTQQLKSQLKTKRAELEHLKENVVKQRGSLLVLDSESKLREVDSDRLLDDIKTQKDLNKQIIKEKKELLANKIVLGEAIKEINGKLMTILDNKNKSELSISIYAEKEKIFLNEMNKMEENINSSEILIAELNEQISKLQIEMNEEKITEPLNTKYEEIEKENNILDVKIRRYVKAIEICNKNRVTTLKKKRDLSEPNKSTQESMLIPNKKNKN